MQITKKHYLCNQKVEMMQNKGQVTIHIEGKYGAEKLTPENYDITLMQSVLEYAIALLDLDKRKETPTTTFHIENGSVNTVIENAVYTEPFVLHDYSDGDQVVKAYAVKDGMTNSDIAEESYYVMICCGI